MKGEGDKTRPLREKPGGTMMESNKKGRENVSGSNSLVMLSLTDVFNVLNAEITSKGCFYLFFSFWSNGEHLN